MGAVPRGPSKARQNRSLADALPVMRRPRAFHPRADRHSQRRSVERRHGLRLLIHSGHLPVDRGRLPPRLLVLVLVIVIVLVLVGVLVLVLVIARVLDHRTRARTRRRARLCLPPPRPGWRDGTRRRGGAVPASITRTRTRTRTISEH